ncbi:MAG TPA: GDSL-type esterase/lipase family protein [Pseudomonadales bacterium]|nr:GDSL-type esterase/lipase family protein [Pseudomonadales bacterium]
MTGKLLKLLAINLAVFVLVLACAEGFLRVAMHAPRGIFMGWFPSRLGLYSESMDLPMYGVVDWLVKSNEWGFRGGDLALRKADGVTRIAMIGDSITDGFYVENENTYPSFVQRKLTEHGAKVETINAACGGASIDRELAIFRDAVTRFRPDIVVLTFVSNDVHVLAKISDDMLLHQPANQSDLNHRIGRILFAHTAVGELVLDQVLRHISADYAKNQDAPKRQPNLDPLRYNIDGGNHFADNASLFMKRYAKDDAQILTDNLSPEISTQLQRYLLAWDAFMDHAAANRIKPVFVYFPAYPQVYDLSVSMKVRDILRDHSEQHHVPFLDLTPVLRAQGETVLHLAPKDFHLNPTGNQVIGTALAGFLLENNLLESGPVKTAASSK